MHPSDPHDHHASFLPPLSPSPPNTKHQPSTVNHHLPTPGKPSLNRQFSGESAKLVKNAVDLTTVITALFAVIRVGAADELTEGEVRKNLPPPPKKNRTNELELGHNER